MRSGRPLRFLAATLGGWTAVRIAVLLPDIDSAPDLIRAVAPPLAAATLPAVQAAQGAPAAVAQHRLVRVAVTLRAARPTPVAVAASTSTSAPASGGPVIAVAAASEPQAGVEPGIPPPLAPTPAAQADNRLAGSAWLLARGGPAGTLSGGRLGGSQAGVRLTYALGESRRVAIAARLATPLEGRGREAAFGVEWRPTSLPVRLVAEQRVALDGGRGGPTLMAIGGVGPTGIGAGFALESYAQAGAVARDRVEGFADGAVRVARRLVTIGRSRLDIGAGSWGAVQREAGRLDLGPTIGLQVPVGSRAIRVTADWRQRVAGNARPGSGPALSIGSDF